MTRSRTRPRGKPRSPAKAAGAPSYQIVASESPADEHKHVLKHGDTFAVLDHFGDIRPGALGELGLYHGGTRFLSLMSIEIEDHRPLFLASSLRDNDGQLIVALTNPDLMEDGQVRVLLGTLQLSLRKFLWRGAYHQRLEVENHGLENIEVDLTLRFAADYVDVFEVRGAKRTNRGRPLPTTVEAQRVIIGYRGLDDVTRRTSLRFTPAPQALDGHCARFDLALAPRQRRTFDVVAACLQPPSPARASTFDEAHEDAEAALQRSNAWCCHLRTTNQQVNDWVDRAIFDVHMMTTELGSGPYPYAGIPWFNTPFGRDGIITALESMWMRPHLARGVLGFLAATQATELIPDQDAEPGKIVHEMRSGEMASLGEVPFGRYYGSVDSTPLFVMLAGAYFQRTADLEFLESIWPNLEAALDWIDQYGDRDGDGFVEYQRRSSVGLMHQGWKDSDDAVFHADGTLAHGPIALCEVQGYVHAARLAGASLASRLGRQERAAELRSRAESLRDRFDEAFWCEDLSLYALALDGDKMPCRVRSSNAGQCLFTGIAAPERGRRVARALASAEFFSGWGIRTVASSEARYNPMGYHTGSVWPHDNALIAMGLGRMGVGDEAVRLVTALFEASLHFDLQRMPELFCGFSRHPADPPVAYPVACAPQAWSAASVLSLLQTCLGLRIDASRSQVRFTRPRLPPMVEELRIHDLQIGDATVDLLLLRHEDDVGVNVLGRSGEVEIIVLK